jgi:hypothetical protein
VFTPFHKPPYPYLYGRSVDETTTISWVLGNGTYYLIDV